MVATEPKQLWVADVTYAPTVHDRLYLGCVPEVFSRLMIGWSIAFYRKTELAVDAVTMAVHRSGEYRSQDPERELRRHRAGQHGRRRGLLRQRPGRKRLRHAGV